MDTTSFMLTVLPNASTSMWLFLVMGSVVVLVVLIGAVKSYLATREREQTRREIAAYAAEGTIDPETAIKMIRAGRTPDEAFGDIFSAKAEAKAAKAAQKAEKKAAKMTINVGAPQ